MFYGRQVFMQLAAGHPHSPLGPRSTPRRLRIACVAGLSCWLAAACSGTSSEAAGGGEASTQGAGAKRSAPPKPASIPAEECIARIEAAKTWAASQSLPDQREAVMTSLREVAERGAQDLLRANAALLLGALYEEADQRKDAIGYYRQALVLAPEDPSGRAVLALALAADNQWEEALTEQRLLIQQVPDDLEAWLVLGEMEFKGGHPDQAKEVYLGYETRRRGLLEGLTRKQDGAYVVAPQERSGCAQALAVASDNGTALALAYALRTEPEASVRLAIVETMGVQRLLGYEVFLKERRAVETDAGVLEALKWALAEIARDGVDTRPGAAPVRPEELRSQLGIEAVEPVPVPEDAVPDGAVPSDKDGTTSTASTTGAPALP